MLFSSNPEEHCWVSRIVNVFSGQVLNVLGQMYFFLMAIQIGIIGN